VATTAAENPNALDDLNWFTVLVATPPDEERAPVTAAAVPVPVATEVTMEVVPAEEATGAGVDVDDTAALPPLEDAGGGQV